MSLHRVDIKSTESESSDSELRDSDPDWELKTTNLKSSKDEFIKVYKCKTCVAELKSVKDFLEHYKEHTISEDKNINAEEAVDIQYRCLTCHIVTKNITCHVTTHEVFWCRSCKAKFGTKLELEEHWAIHVSKVYDCKTCAARLGSQEDFKKHYQVHMDDEKLSTFGEPEVFQVAKMAKVGTQCLICQVVLWAPYWHTHVRTHYIDQSSEAFRCSECGKGYKSKERLNAHTRTHSSDRPHICEVCGKGFCLYARYERHRYTHDEIKPLICQFCGKGFTHRYNLKGHERIHTGEKPYQCTKCPERYTHNVSLKTHMKKVHGIDLWKEQPDFHPSEEPHDDAEINKTSATQNESAVVQDTEQNQISSNSMSNSAEQNPKDTATCTLQSAMVQEKEVATSQQNAIKAPTFFIQNPQDVLGVSSLAQPQSQIQPVQPQFQSQLLARPTSGEQMDNSFNTKSQSTYINL